MARNSNEFFDKQDALEKILWIMNDKEIGFNVTATRIGLGMESFIKAIDITDTSIPFDKTQDKIKDFIKYNYKGDVDD